MSELIAKAYDRPRVIPTPVADVELAWLAGLWDGEGSVGATRSYATGKLVLIPQIQLHMTHEPTVARAVELLRCLGAVATSYQPQRKQTHHKDAYHFAVRRTVWLRDIAQAVRPHSLTKRAHWDLLHELCEARIARQGVDAKNGWLRRGGPPGWAAAYSEREIEIGDLLYSMNYRTKAVAT